MAPALSLFPQENRDNISLHHVWGEDVCEKGRGGALRTHSNENRLLVLKLSLKLQKKKRCRQGKVILWVIIIITSVPLPRRVCSWGCLGGELQNPPMAVVLQPQRATPASSVPGIKKLH